MTKESQTLVRAQIGALEIWLKSHGVWWDEEAIFIDAESTVEMNNGKRVPLCIRAKRAIAVDDIVCKIPKTAILSPRNSSISRIIEKEELGGALALTLAVLYERQLGSNSTWGGYLDSLPIAESGLPIYQYYLLRHRKLPKAEKIRVDERLRKLAGTEVGRSLEDDLALLEHDYHELILPVLQQFPKIFSPLSNFNFHRFVQTSTVVASRCFMVDSIHGDAMVPLADIFNHRTRAEHVHLESEDSDPDSLAQPIELRIVRPISEAGTEVNNTYGDHSNAFLFMKYGFTEPENPMNIVCFTIEDVVKECELDLAESGLEERLDYWRLMKQSKMLEDEMQQMEEDDSSSRRNHSEDDQEVESSDEIDVDDREDESDQEEEDEFMWDENELHAEEESFQVDADGMYDQRMALLIDLMCLSPDEFEQLKNGQLDLKDRLASNVHHRAIVNRLIESRQQTYSPSEGDEKEKMHYFASLLKQGEKTILQKLKERLQNVGK